MPHLLLIARLKAFLADRRGVSAVEFALIAPAMIAAYFGIAEISQGMLADGKAGRVASAVGDLAAQDDKLTNAEVTDIFKIGGILIKPFAATDLKMRISSLTANSAGVVKVDWSDGYGGLAALTVGSTQTVPAGLIAAGQTVILSETNFKYTSEAQKFVDAPINFSRKYHLRPRKSDSITRCATC